MEAVGSRKSQETAGTERFMTVGPAASTHNHKGVEKKGENPLQNISPHPRKQEVTSEAKIERIAKAMDNYMKSVQRDLKIQVNRDTGNIMVKVISREDGRTIREIPPEELLNLAARMEEMAGVLFNKTA